MSQLPNIFIAYAHKDAQLLDRIRIQLNPLRRGNHCRIFYDGVIRPGERWDNRIRSELEKADIFVLLITADFLDSNYIQDVELPKALEKEKLGKSKVIPLIMRDCLWQYTIIKHFQVILFKDRPIAPRGFAFAARQIASELKIFDKVNSGYSIPKKLTDGSSLGENEFFDPFHENMIFIPGGTFNMGDVFNEGSEDEKPVHRVVVEDFYLSKIPVTQKQWNLVMNVNPSYFSGEDDHPVESISWLDAKDFIRRLNLVTGKNYRLPTEVEWEFAARECGKEIRFGNGKDTANPNEINFNGDEKYQKMYSVAGINRHKTTKVGFFSPNQLGLHDMSGNVWEWCEDTWHDSYEGAPVISTAWIDGDPKYRVARGGAWDLEAYHNRTSARLVFDTEGLYNFLGLRLSY